MALSEFTMRPRRLSEVASRYGLELRGPDAEIVTLGPLSTRSAHRERLLTFVTESRWLTEFGASGVAAAVVSEALADDAGDRSLLVTTGDPEETFYALLVDSAEAGEWEKLGDAIGEGSVIAPSAVIESSVEIGDDCHIMPGAVLLANTRLGDRVTVKPNATLGGDGLQVRTIRGRRRVVPHAGGVDVGDNAMIGSQTCVDRGLFGDFTTIGAGTQIDNLVHVAHSVTVGVDVTVVACAEISGSVRIGDGAWIGPRAAINPSLDLEDHAFVGTGAVVVRSLPAHALAYGNPARQHGWVCRCTARLDPDAGHCGRCRRSFRFAGDAVTVEP